MLSLNTGIWLLLLMHEIGGVSEVCTQFPCRDECLNVTGQTAETCTCTSSQVGLPYSTAGCQDPCVAECLPIINVTSATLTSGETQYVYSLGAEEPTTAEVLIAVDGYATGSLSYPKGFTPSFSSDHGQTFHTLEPFDEVTHIKVKFRM